MIILVLLLLISHLEQKMAFYCPFCHWPTESNEQVHPLEESGEQDAEALAERARGRLRAKLPDLRLALEGRVEAHHQFLLQQILAHTDFLEQSIEKVQQEIDKRLIAF